MGLKLYLTILKDKETYKMAKIIYGVAGEDFVHSGHAHLIWRRLIDAGHDVIFAASEKSYASLQEQWKMQP